MESSVEGKRVGEIWHKQGQPQPWDDCEEKLIRGILHKEPTPNEVPASTTNITRFMEES